MMSTLFCVILMAESRAVLFSSRLRPGSLQIPQNFKGGWSNVKFFKDIPGLIN